MCSAHCYVKKYLTSLDFDNFHMTADFQEIDIDQKMKSQKSLLPLRNSEKLRKISSLHLKSSEVSQIFVNYLALAFAALLTYFIYSLAQFQFHFSSSLYEFGKLQILFSLSSQFEMTIKGNSSLSKLLRDMYSPLANSTVSKHSEISLIGK